MLTVKQFAELAWAGAMHEYEEAIKFHNYNTLAKDAWVKVMETKVILDDLSKKENYVEASNVADSEMILRAMDLGSGQVKEFKSKPFVPEYVVKVKYHDPKRSYLTKRISFATLEEANVEFVKWKNMSYANKDLDDRYQVTVLLLEKIREGLYRPLDKVSPETWKSQAQPSHLKEASQAQQSTPQVQYQVRVYHLTGKIQTLEFDFLKAAEATFELLKYELEVNRIRGASMFKVVSNIGYWQELNQIGDKEEDAF